MHPDRWNRIKEILDVSLRLEPEERAAYLTRICEADTELRAEVESLIEAHEDAGDIFEAPALPEPADPLIGARLGAYEIQECIGSGGMGSVYRAVRADQVFQKEVAIKVVRRGLDLEHVVRQFRRERQIAATLEHPNLATLIDGGTTSEGLPYFVMEFIRGEPIDVYCDEAGLGVRERLELFATVCAAVDFAHKRGVVHRDIKPGNILVNSSGLPKLLDFGIAKILNPEALPAGRDSVVTIAAAMTPDYASPEQLEGGEVTAASDVYSLGVLLYELLTGQRPRHQKTALWGRDEVSEPEPPSKVAAHHALAADLDNIVLMAMHRDPSQRYATAGLLEQDIRRYLDARPVLARKDTLRYRISKFVRRQKVAVASVAVAVALFGSVLVVGSLRERLDDSGVQPVTTPLTSMPGREVQPYFSPDGKRIVYVWSGEDGANPDVYMQTLDNGQASRITTDPAGDLSPVWSPDGKRIAWLRTGPKETAIFVAPAQEAAGRKTHVKLAEVYPVGVETVGRHLDWSPDGRYLAVADKTLAEQPFHIALVAVRDASKREITLPPEKIIGDMSPAFSPDGQWLAFLRAVSSGINEVYIAPTAGGPARRVTFDNREVVALAWTPDGRSIVFSSNRRGNSALWQVPAGGGTPVRLPLVGENASDPAFSRTGRKMVYTLFFMDTNIWRIDTAGRGPATKLISSTQYDSSPQYSPDGSRVVFRSTRSGSNEIWICDSEGRAPIQLTHFAGPLTGTPRWSPDGASVAFDSRPEGQADIFTIPASGGEAHRVTNDGAEDVVPSWSRDGRWIYFASNRTGAWQVWRAPVTGGAEEQVTRLGGFAAFESPDGRYLYYAKGRNTSGLWRKHLPDGDEEVVLEQIKPGYWGYWAVARDGIYFADQPQASGQPGIYFYDFAQKRTRLLATVPKPLAVTDSAFALSPDRQQILYTQVDQSGSDILMLEHYR